MPVLTLAKYTVKLYIKERVLLVVLLFGVILMISSYILSPLAVGAQRKIVVDVGLALVSILGIMLIILFGAGSYYREREKGILPALLAKPVSRVDFLLGKYMGTAITVDLLSPAGRFLGVSPDRSGIGADHAPYIGRRRQSVVVLLLNILEQPHPDLGFGRYRFQVDTIGQAGVAQIGAEIIHFRQK